MSPKYKKSKTEQYIIVYILNDVLNAIFLWWCGASLYSCIVMFVLKGVFIVLVSSVLCSDGAFVTRGEPSPTPLNGRPIIGVLSQEQAHSFKNEYLKENFTSYIAASYVKAIESAGARVVPIMIGKSRKYYEEILSKVNGVLFPGGGTYFNQSNGYADAGQHIYDIAQDLNDNGDYFPIFGTCLGFELLVILASGRGYPENRVTCRSYGNAPLIFTEDFEYSKMFRDIDDETVEVLEHEDITINYHQFCIVDENMERHKLNKDWQVTSYSYDNNRLKFIASIENKRYPFYGVQFHPEKAAFEWKLINHYAHSPNAVKANWYFMDFFVGECRKNLHAFADEEEENKYLIYNYKPYFTGATGSSFSQCYFFEPKGIASL